MCLLALDLFRFFSEMVKVDLGRRAHTQRELTRIQSLWATSMGTGRLISRSVILAHGRSLFCSGTAMALCNQMQSTPPAVKDNLWSPAISMVTENWIWLLRTSVVKLLQSRS